MGVVTEGERSCRRVGGRREEGSGGRSEMEREDERRGGREGGRSWMRLRKERGVRGRTRLGRRREERGWRDIVCVWVGG